jgi:gas vesicle protein
VLRHRPEAITTYANWKGSKMKKLLKTLLGTSLYILEQSDGAQKGRNRTASRINDFRDAVQQKYEDAADRVAKASRAIRGEDNPALGNAVSLAVGIGVGIGLGLLFAPASGQETRSAIAGSVQQFGNQIRKRVSSERARATAIVG